MRLSTTELIWDAKDSSEQRLERWYEVKQKLERLNKEEKALRLAIFRENFPTLREGTESVSLNPGWKLVGKQPLIYKLDSSGIQRVATEFHRIGESIEPLIRWKPELNAKEYRELPENVKQLMREIVTITEGLPTLSIVPAKDED